MVAFPATIGRPEKPRTSASPLMPRRQRPSASQPAPVTSGHDTTPAIIGSPDEPRASAILANNRSPDPRPAPITPAMATFPATDEVRTNFGLMDPAGPPLTGHSSTLPPAAIVAATGKFKAPSSTRRTSPVMTNDRVSPPSPRPSPSPRPRAECRRNGSAIRRPISCGMPAALPVSMSASLPMHPDILFPSAPNAKTRKAQGLAGFRPGAFLPLTLLLCHK